MAAPLCFLALCGLVACGSGDPGDPPPPPPDTDPSEVLFQPDHMLEVQIELDPADWAVLRAEPDDIGHPKYTCDSQPATRKYTYFPAEVTIDDELFSNVAVRKKGGFGSLSSTRPGLKVKSNEYVPGQEIHGLKRLTLNNNHQDSAILKQCLTYALFADAGLPASRCSFAHVTVNGEDLGVYSNVESIKKPFLRRHFADDGGNLYEGGGDFRAGIVRGLQPKVNKENPDCTDLDRMVAALEAPDNGLGGALDAAIDVDQFLSFWAMEVITDHWDGYTNGPNNFFVYHDPASDRFHFIPWGVDSTFEGRARSSRPASVFACGILPWRMYDVLETQPRYIDRLNELLDTVWNPAELNAEIDRMEALVTPFAAGNNVSELAAQIQTVRDFVDIRRDVLGAELADGPPVWPTPLLDPPCLVNVGSMTGTFQATWGTLNMFPSGSGTLAGTMNENDVASANVNATAGFDEESKVAIQLFAEQPDGTLAVLFFIIHKEEDFLVGSQPFNLVDLVGISGFYDPVADTFGGGGLLLGGSLTLDQVGVTDGDPVTGSFSVDVVEL